MSCSIKKSGFLAAALFFSSWLFSQNDELRPPKTGSFKNELAVFPIHLDQIGKGASLVFRRNTGETVLKNWRRNRSIRLTGSLFGYDGRDSFPFTRVIFDSLITQASVGQTTSRAVQIGYEWRFQKGRFEHWTGIDAGLRWGRRERATTIHINDGGTQLQDQFSRVESDFWAPGIALFWGCRAFLAPRFSVGIEIGFPIEYDITQSLIFEGSAPPQTFESGTLEMGRSRPRFLCLAFHF